MKTLALGLIDINNDVEFRNSDYRQTKINANSSKYDN